MKLEAKVKIKAPIDEAIALSVNGLDNSVKVNVDADDVSADESDNREWEALVNFFSDIRSSH